MAENTTTRGDIVDVQALANVDGQAPLAQSGLVARLREAILTLGHHRRRQEMHKSMLKSRLLTLKASLAEKTAASVRIDEDTACHRCGRTLNSTVCTVIDGRIRCPKCGKSYP